MSHHIWHVGRMSFVSHETNLVVAVVVFFFVFFLFLFFVFLGGGVFSLSYSLPQ